MLDHAQINALNRALHFDAGMPQAAVVGTSLAGMALPAFAGKVSRMMCAISFFALWLMANGQGWLASQCIVASQCTLIRGLYQNGSTLLV